MALFDDRDEADDVFADTRMTFGEHLEDLRLHLWRAVFGFLVALAVSFFLGRPALRFIAAPVEQQLGEFYAARVQRVSGELDRGDPTLERINQPIDVRMSFDRAELAGQAPGARPADAPPGERVTVTARIEEPLRLVIKLHQAQFVVGRRPTLATMSIQEAFMAYVKVSLACALVIGSPWIFWQIWLFVAAGLYQHEKRLVNVYLPFSLTLFLAGVFLCEFLVIPQAIRALLWFNEWVGLEPELRFNEWLGFAILMPLVFGISFQLPLVMMFLERIGIFTVQSYIAKWRIACFLIHVLAAIIVPSMDIISMEGLALPMFGLYGLGIVLCRLNRRRDDTDAGVPETDEMVGV